MSARNVAIAKITGVSQRDLHHFIGTRGLDTAETDARSSSKSDQSRSGSLTTAP